MAVNKEIFFEDLAEFWNYAMQESNAYHKDSRSNNDINWSGGLTWEQTKTLAINGWTELITEIEKYREIVQMLLDAHANPMITFKVSSLIKKGYLFFY